MNLSRDEWIEMWEAVKKIEMYAESLVGKPRTKLGILEKVDGIKVQIQTVIGRME